MFESFVSGLQAVDFTLQLVVFLTITLAAFVVLAITFFAGSLFGADHDISHDHDMGGHDVSTDHDGGDHGSTISVFSPKIFFVFLAAFGAGGSIASLYGSSAMAASGWGMLVGASFGAIAYFGLFLLYGAQANSVIRTTDAVGQIGYVSTSITEKGGVGEVEVNVSGQSKTYMAQAKGGISIPRGSQVKVTAVQGVTLLVEAVS